MAGETDSRSALSSSSAAAEAAADLRKEKLALLEKDDDNDGSNDSGYADDSGNPSPKPLSSSSVSTSVALQHQHLKQQQQSVRYRWQTWFNLAVLSIALLFGAIVFDSFFNQQPDYPQCSMSYMWPEYHHVTSLGTMQSKFATKYHLYLYRETSIDLPVSSILTGVPVLFIPGNAGSHKQIRSIAAATAKLSRDMRQSISDNGRLSGKGGLDVFTISTNEELTAFHGYSLIEQATFVNDAIRHILHLYAVAGHNRAKYVGTDENGNERPLPQSVIVIGHSMGGVVARTAVTLSTHRPGSINTIITIASPHMQPPISFESYVYEMYAEINRFWTSSFINSTLADSSITAKDEELSTAVETFRDMALVSIAGGNPDFMITSDACDISALVPRNHGFTAFTSGIPRVWTTSDHLCSLWCGQLVEVLSKALIDIVDVSRYGQTKSLPKRIEALERHLLSGYESSIQSKSVHTLAVESAASNNEWHKMANSVKIVHHDDSESASFTARIDFESTGDTLHLVPLKNDSEDATVELISSISPQPAHGLRPVLCRTVTSTAECINVAPSLRTGILPQRLDATESSEPFSQPLFTYQASLSADEVDKHVQSGATHWGWHFIAGSLVRGSISEPTAVVADPSSILSSSGQSADVANVGVHSHVRIDVPESSLLSYSVQLELKLRAGLSPDATPLFWPIVRQSNAYDSEAKYHYNANQFTVDFHGRGIYLFDDTVPLVSEGSMINQWTGVQLDIWTDPSHIESFTLTAKLDWYRSVGRIARRLDMVLIVLPLILTLLLFDVQLRHFVKHRSMLAFTPAAAKVLLTRLPLLTAFLLLIPPLLKAVEHWQQLVGREVHGLMFLGTLSDSPVWLLLLVLGLSVGLMLLVGYVLFIVVKGIAFFAFALKSSWKPTEDSDDEVSAASNYETSGISRRLVAAFITTMLVATFIPYQFAFVIIALSTILACARTQYRLLNIKSQKQRYQLEQQLEYQMTWLMIVVWLLPYNAPLLAIWGKNLAVGWYEDAPSNHNLANVMAFFAILEMAGRHRCVIANGSGFRLNAAIRLTSGLIWGIAMHALLRGFRQPYTMHTAISVLAWWCVIALHVQQSQIVKRLIRFMSS
ncbi:PGAP1-domain-containing protein [Ramicandelaber brevisporus]|nr:PGAP1-domain-containing protein [Ramicandelaber brevisporus]